MALIVQKYGGKSLATPEHLCQAADRIRAVKQEGKDVLVVVSAMGGTTDELIRLARETVQSPTQRELDMLLTAGERISMSLLAMALEERNISAISFTGSQAGIVTTSDHSNAKIIELRPHRVQKELADGKVVILAGFQGVSEEKEVTTLGRGGSDTTAVALAAHLGADYCEILTDVDGLYEADPKRVPEARILSQCDYEEALELASLGAKMQARSLDLARRHSVPIRITSSHRKSEGTWIRSGDETHSPLESACIKGIATKEGFHYFETEMPLKLLLSLTKEYAIALRFFSGSNTTSHFLIEDPKEACLKRELETRSIAYRVQSSIGIVSLVGEGIGSESRLLPLVHEALDNVGAQCYLVSTNALSITCAVEAKDLTSVAKKLRGLFL